MTLKGSSRTSETEKTNWVYYLLLLLVVEKIAQHIAVTLGFYFNWNDIGSTVAVSPTVLMILGGIVAVLFVLCLWGLVKKDIWAVDLLIALALFDIIGEFVAQGKIMIAVTISFVVALLLLILTWIYRRQLSRT